MAVFKAALADFLQHVVIDSKETGVGAIKLYGAQRRFLTEVFAGLERDIHWFVILKARQLGLSTVVRILVVFWAFMHSGLRVALIFDTDKNKEEAREEITLFLDRLPKSHRIPITKHPKSFLQLENGSRISYLVAGIKKSKSSGGLGRSLGINCCGATEMSSWADIEGLRALERSLAKDYPDRLYIWESTARGFNIFHKLWKEAKADDLVKKAIFIGWWAKENYTIKKDTPLFERYGLNPPTDEEQRKIDLVAERYGHEVTMEQLAWFRHEYDPDKEADDTSEHEGQDIIQQELPWYEEEAFLLSGSQFFPAEKLSLAMADAERVSPKGYNYFMTDEFAETVIGKGRVAKNSELKIWEEPDPYALYIVGADPAFGASEDCYNHCLDTDTELLTRTGWRRWDEIHVGDEAVCFDLGTEKYSYGAVQRVIVRGFSGQMVRLRSDGIDCLATPEHRVVLRSRQRASGRYKMYPWKFVPASDVPTLVMIPKGGAPIGGGIDGLTSDLCRILGWVITDGSIHDKRAANRVLTLHQSTETTKLGVNIWMEMDRYLSAHGVKRYDCAEKVFATGPVRRRASNSQWYFGVKFSSYVLRWLGDDIHRIPRQIIEHGNREQLEALFLGLMEGDGTSHHGKWWTTFYPGDAEGLADDFQEVALRLGYSASKAFMNGQNQWCVRLSGRDHHHIQKPDRADYEGTVWDITVPTGAFVARRQGKAFVTGNCAQVLRCYADGVDQVAEYCSMDPDTRQFAWVLLHLCGAYNSCRFLLELNGPGHAVWTEIRNLRQLIAMGYLRQTMEERGLTNIFRNVRDYVFAKEDSLIKNPSAFHWETNTKRKVAVMERLRGLFNLNQVRIKSIECLKEMGDVVRDGDSIKGEGTSPYDRVMALSLAVRAWEDTERKKLIAEQRTRENEAKRNTMSYFDMQKMFSEGIVAGFFREQKRDRLKVQRQSRRGQRWQW